MLLQETAGPMSLREKQKAKRRDRILDTTEQLIRETGNTDFSMRLLAKSAEVSPATPFNLFGSKEGLLYTLLLRSLQRFENEGLAFKSLDPCYHVIEAAENAVDILVKDAEFLRPLYRVLLGVLHPVHRPVFMKRTLDYWTVAAATVSTKVMQDDNSQKILATALMAHFTGLMEMWIQHDYSDLEFREHVICGVILDVSSIIHNPKHRGKMTAWLEEAKERLTAQRPNKTVSNVRWRV